MTGTGTLPLCEYCGAAAVKSAGRRFCSQRCSNTAVAARGGMEKRCKAEERVVPLQDRLARRLIEADPPAHCTELGACQIWTGRVNRKGYGEINRGGRGLGSMLAHRASWEVHRGSIPDGLNVLHRCDNPPCCNPDHLFLGTLADNNADMLAKGRYGVLPEHLPRGERHALAKLTEDRVREARGLNAAGIPKKHLAKRYGVAESTMDAAIRGKTWGHVALLVMLTVVLLGGCSSPAAASPLREGIPAQVVRVIDGDTFQVMLGSGRRNTVRLLGADTPETRDPRKPVQCFGPEASAFAKTTLLNQHVTLVADPTQEARDRYDRALFYVRLADGRDYSVEAARAGMARSYVYDRKPVLEHAAIEAAQAEAKAAGRGLWGACSV